VPIVLNNRDVEAALDLRECLRACEQAYLELAHSRAVNRPTSQCYLPHRLDGATYSFKSVEGGVKNLGVLALRITSDILREEDVNGARRLNKLPLANGQYVGLVQLFSIETGELLAIMPDGFLQQVRVGVTSALAAQCLARSDSHVLGLIGSGGQARAHLRALAAVRPLRVARVFSPSEEHRTEFARTMKIECGIDVRAVESVRDAVEGADLVCTATNSSRALISAEHLQPGMHYNAIREFEVDESVFGRSDVVAIHTRYGGAYHHLPDGQREDLPGVRREKTRDWARYPEIADLLSGRAAARTRNDQITFFLNNIGTGVQFAALGYTAWQGARRAGLGHEIPAEWFLQDIKP
jgi:ornithine cyclodeaminase/alanine dehydrogenase-like protein (mu-crystallin family)